MKVRFLPNHEEIDRPPGTKILVAARQAKADIRFGCAACNCGTCAVKIKKGESSPITPPEEKLLKALGIYQEDLSVRLSCQARISETDLEVDLSFQQKYSPDEKKS